jgi:hypothetical protein
VINDIGTIIDKVYFIVIKENDGSGCDKEDLKRKFEEDRQEQYAGLNDGQRNENRKKGCVLMNELR